MIIKFKSGAIFSLDSTTATLASVSYLRDLRDRGGDLCLHKGKNKGGDVYHDKLMVCDGSRKWKLVSCGRTDWFIQQVMELSKFKDRILEDQ